MCRALLVLCAASTEERLVELKRAALSAAWELVGGARSTEELGSQAAEWRPDVVVVDASLGADAPGRARAARPGVRVVSVGALDGVDEVAAAPADLRQVILGLPRPGGPVGI